MRVDTFQIGGIEVTMRLSAQALAQHCKDYGKPGENPVVCVMEAVDDMSAKISLMTKALNHKGNDNLIRNGADLLDLMADNGMGQDAANHMILTMARTCGQLTDEELAKLEGAINGRITKIVNLFAGEVADDSKPAPQDAEEENPTRIPTPQS